MENLTTYKINYFVDVYEDSYSEGELNNVNYYEGEFFTKASSPKEAIKEFFENELFFSLDFKYMDTVQDEFLERFTYSLLCDNNNEEVKKEDSIYKKWLEDKVILYTNTIYFNIYEIKETEIKELN